MCIIVLLNLRKLLIPVLLTMHIDSNQPSSGTCRPSVGRVSRDHGATATVAGSSQDKLGGDCCKLISVEGGEPISMLPSDHLSGSSLLFVNKDVHGNSLLFLAI